MARRRSVRRLAGISFVTAVSTALVFGGDSLRDIFNLSIAQRPSLPTYKGRQYRFREFVGRRVSGLRAFAMGSGGGGNEDCKDSNAQASVRTSLNEQCAALIRNAESSDPDIKTVRSMKGEFIEMPLVYPNPKKTPGSTSMLYGRIMWSNVGADGRLYVPKEKRPVVIVVHTAVGQQEDFITWRMKSLAANGYVALAVDIFGTPHAIWDPKLGKEIRAPLYENRKLMVDRLKAGIKAASEQVVQADVSRLAIIGFCFGGMVALDTVKSCRFPHIKVASSFHGILDAHPLYNRNEEKLAKFGEVQTKALVFHGGSDPFISKENKEAFRRQMDSLGIPWQMREFHGVKHAFTRPEKITETDFANGFGYNEEAATQSWEETIALLKQTFDGL
ncbi:hypothetical protein AAMO2058_000429200 [Amorphochlora amoebiformis]